MWYLLQNFFYSNSTVLFCLFSTRMLVKVKKDQTRSNIVEQGQTRSNKAKQGRKRPDLEKDSAKFSFLWDCTLISGSNVIPSVASLAITHAATRQADYSQNNYDDEPHAWVRVEREKLQKFARKRSWHGRWLPVSDKGTYLKQCIIGVGEADHSYVSANHSQVNFRYGNLVWFWTQFESNYKSSFFYGFQFVIFDQSWSILIDFESISFTIDFELIIHCTMHWTLRKVPAPKLVSFCKSTPKKAEIEIERESRSFQIT